MKYRVVILPQALKMLEEIHDRRIQEKIGDRIDALQEEPERQGKPLVGELLGFRSIRAVGQRYRVIYRVEREKIVVFVVGVGIRKEGSREDIYELAKKLLRFRLVA